MNESRRGSQWRIWDLHVHTPFSALNSGFGSDFDAYAKKLFERALSKDIAVIGVTDYFLLKGYKRLWQITSAPGRLEELIGAEDADRARRIRLLPNVELRSSVIYRRLDGTDSRVNFHVIFDDGIDPESLEEDFFRELHFTAESSPDGADERWSLTENNIAALGKLLKSQHSEFQGLGDLSVGMMNAVIHHEDVTNVLDRQASRFAGRYLLVVPADEDLSEASWDGQGHQTRKLFIQKAHMLFSANKGTRAFGLGETHPSVDAFREEFKSRKPCVHGSDAHDYDSLFAPAQDRYLWIKADPTFEGLRQLLYEPDSRVYIGERPPALSQLSEKSTRYMKSITFLRDVTATDEERWFSDSLPLNPGLVAIIGNKGSGKSAIADILGLLGDTRNSEHFSFLSQARFLAQKTKLGSLFSAEVEWYSGQKRSRRLDEPADYTLPEIVKYIPQHYLEEICSELLESHDSQFDRELMDVIFSHVSDADSLDKKSLLDLIDYLTSETEGLIAQLTNALEEINAGILGLEEQLTDDYRKSLNSQLEQRLADLKAHDEARPDSILAPSMDPAERAASEEAREELDLIVKEVKQLENDIAEAEGELREAALQVAATGRLLGRIENLSRQLESFYAESASDGAVLHLDVRELVRLVVDTGPIEAVKAQAETRSKAAKDRLSGEPGSLSHQLAASSDKADLARSKLDEPTRRYEKHLQILSAWEKRRDEIEGSDELPNSVKGLRARVNALDDLPSVLAQQKGIRAGVVREIAAAKRRLLSEYVRLYSPVQQFIDNHPVALQQPDLQFSASIAVDGFVEGLLDMIHQGRRGSFQGDREGRELVGRLLAMSDFSTDEGVEAFLEQMHQHLRFDKRDDDYRPVSLVDQLKLGWSPSDIENFIYGLSYLKPRFELKWQNKPLDQLSPGERGNLLLVFYLLIDKRDVPLIIDQPEENLDNYSIATTLIPAIKHAKTQRQIVIVTHNPNLAVVCDADQIIHADIDKADGNKVTYTAGPIENTEITQLVVDVLEGTKPLFDLRDDKYEVLERLNAVG